MCATHFEFLPNGTSASFFVLASQLLLLRLPNQFRLSCPWVSLGFGPGEVYNCVLCCVVFQHFSHISESGKQSQNPTLGSLGLFKVMELSDVLAEL